MAIEEKHRIKILSVTLYSAALLLTTKLDPDGRHHRRHSTVGRGFHLQTAGVHHPNSGRSKYEVQVIAFSSELAIVSLPGDIFVELGLALKKASPFPHTFIAELANGSIGYIPNRSAYAEGNYEVVSARCAEGSGEMVVEGAVKLLKELR